MRSQRIWVFAVLLSVVTGCVANPVTGKKELWVPDAYEIELGQQSAPEFEKQFKGKLDNPQLEAYVAEIGGKVARVSDRSMPYEYTVLNSKVPNAFALPGGKIYVTAGLLRLVENERELAAVLGHETGHVAAKHNMNFLKRQLGARILVEIAERAAGERGATAAQITQVVTNMANLRYSRDNEYQADQLGIRYMSHAGYNPWGMVELLTSLKSMETTRPGLLDEFFLTHPLTSKRIERARLLVQADHPSAKPDAPDPGVTRFQRMKSLLR